jgi:hypothetical protein
MASFVQELFESIFTPGATPTLLLATNASFAALQVVLALMLVATHSVHFLALSIISGALWYSINWFVRELATHQAAEDAKERAQRRSREGTAVPPGDEESETEVEGSMASLRKVRTAAATVAAAAAASGPKTPASRDVEPVGGDRGELKHRSLAPSKVAEASSQQSAVSTEDEWEKVSENEKEKGN